MSIGIMTPDRPGKFHKSSSHIGEQLKMSKHKLTIGKEFDLEKEQEHTLATPLLKTNIILRAMYRAFDIIYGKKGSLAKLRILEIMARYPYWAWENGGYHQITKLFTKTKDRVPDDKKEQFLRWIDLGRISQDNEQEHLFLIEQIIHKKKIRLGWFRHSHVLSVLVAGYYYLTRLMFWFCPVCSFSMNAAFESHAEHKYMQLAKEHPEWDNENLESIDFRDYPRQNTLRDLLRRIALDEREHMHNSLNEVKLLKSRD